MGSERGKNSYLSVPKVVFITFIIVISLFILISILFTGSSDDKKYSDSKSGNLFFLADKAERIIYTIKSRENLDRLDIHRVYIKVDVPEKISHEKIKAVAQKIVKDTIAYEKCQSIAIDFGPYGYVDFAPYGNWLRISKNKPGNYRNYRFKYIFF